MHGHNTKGIFTWKKFAVKTACKMKAVYENLNGRLQEEATSRVVLVSMDAGQMLFTRAVPATTAKVHRTVCHQRDGKSQAYSVEQYGRVSRKV